MEMTEMQAIMEAIIYVADDPVKLEQFKEVFPEEDTKAILQALKGLMESFNSRPGGMLIREVAGGWRMTTRPEHHEQIRSYLKTRPNAKLSMAALETLAVIAYKQPVTLAEILAIRGKKSSTALQTLLERKMVAILGRKPVVGRPILYGTSKEFLIHFGLNSLSDFAENIYSSEQAQAGHLYARGSARSSESDGPCGCAYQDLSRGTARLQHGRPYSPYE
jgi:segregation and condensation protein B